MGAQTTAARVAWFHAPRRQSALTGRAAAGTLGNHGRSP